MTMHAKAAMALIATLYSFQALPSIAAPPPVPVITTTAPGPAAAAFVADKATDQILDWGKIENIKGFAFVQANKLMLPTVEYPISNFGKALGFSRVYLRNYGGQLKAIDNGAKAYVNVNFDFNGWRRLPSDFTQEIFAGEICDDPCPGGPFKKMDPIVEAIVNPANTGYALAMFRIIASGNIIIAGDGAAGPFKSPLKVCLRDAINKECVKILGPGLQSQALTLSQSSLMAWSPDWDYWDPLIDSGLYQVSDAWEAVDDEVQAQASQFGLGYSIQPFTITWSSVSEAVNVPGPTPIAGGAMAFTFSRRIRKRIRGATYKHSHR